MYLVTGYHYPAGAVWVSGRLYALIHFLILALYKLFIYLPSFLTLFLSYFLLSLYFLSFLLISFFTRLLPDLSTSTIGPFRFQAGGHRR